MMTTPDFLSLSKIEEKRLADALELARLSIAHAGEKGRSLEQVVLKWLRTLLPAEYGLSTGFVLWLSPSGLQMSPQLDIIIDDAIRCGAIINLDACDVFPLEAVYGYVEVKASLRSSGKVKGPWPGNSLEACIAKNRRIRRMNHRRFWAPRAGSPPETLTTSEQWLSLRSFIIAFEASGKVANDLARLAGQLATRLRQAPDAYFHGVFIPGHGLVYTSPVTSQGPGSRNLYEVRHTARNALLQFRSTLLQSLATFTRMPDGWSPALDQYFGHTKEWMAVEQAFGLSVSDIEEAGG